MEEQKKPKHDFETFKKKVAAKAITSMNRYGRASVDVVYNDFTIEEIMEIIESGDLEALRDLSRYYYRVNGIYRNNVNMLATLPLFDTVITPIFSIRKNKPTEESAISAFYAACDFVDKLEVKKTFSNILREILISGIYYGILRFADGRYLIQSLPMTYCRTRFKDYNGLDILEFNLNYFSKITDENERKQEIECFPRIVQQAYRKLEKRKLQDCWIEIPAAVGGICFSYGDRTPLLIPSIIDLYKLQEATDREAIRDEKGLYKLLIQKMPIDNKGELVFSLDEVADIHASVADMLRDNDTIDILTTFGDTSLESLQDSNAASQSTNRIEKYKINAFDALGRSSLLFNAEGSASLGYSIQRDEAVVFSILEIFASWIKYQINNHIKRNKISFDFTFLPTTIFNQDKIQKQYFQGAQYGYSKMYAGVALGIKQMNQISLMTFENDFLKMNENMIPLQSTYTTSGKDIKEEAEKKNEKSSENVVVSQKDNDILNEGGRPSLDDTQKSEHTEANIASEK